MPKLKSGFRLLVSSVALLLAPAAHAGFDGKSFSAYYAFPDIDSVYAFASASPPSFAVGAGVETVFDVEGVTDIGADFSDTSLTLVLSTVLSNPTWSNTSFNGLVFDLTAGGPLTITSVTVDGATTMAGFDASRVGFGPDRVSINWSGLSYVDGTTVVVNFTSAVPEPSSWALLLGGLALLGSASFIRRRG